MKQIKAAIWLSLLCLFANVPATNGQVVFKAQLLNAVDSVPLPFSMVAIKETNQQAVTDSTGQFSVQLSKKHATLTLEITSLISKATITYRLTGAPVEKIYVDVYMNPLTEFVFRGMSAREVVEKAVKKIPENYETQSHFAYSFYREYEIVNGLCINFAEADVVAMYKLTLQKNRIVPSESFAVPQMRRSKYRRIIEDFGETNLDETLQDDPIYNLELSSLNPAHFDKYRFNFDTTRKNEDYVINYFRPDFSSDVHGIGYYTYQLFCGEAYERGTLTIDRHTFAIKKIVRKAAKNPSYDYGGPLSQLNILFPSKKYFFRFVDGTMEAEYEFMGGRYHLKHLYHKFTNDFYYTGFGGFAYRFDEYTEWSCDSVSRYVGEAIVNKFFPKTYLARRHYDYNPQYWLQERYPFHFEERERVFKDLEVKGPLDRQFLEESTRE